MSFVLVSAFQATHVAFLETEPPAWMNSVP